MSTFEETLGQQIAWLLNNGADGNTLDVAKYLIKSGVVADPAEVERLRGTGGLGKAWSLANVERLEAEVARLERVVLQQNGMAEDEQKRSRVAEAERDRLAKVVAAAEGLAAAVWRESQQGDRIINDAGIMQDIVYRLRAALDAADAPQPEEKS